MDTVGKLSPSKKIEHWYAFVEVVTVLLALLFVYTATSKFLDYNKFVFQMKLAPVPVIKLIAPTLGWLIPSIEMLTVVGLTIGIFIPRLLEYSLFAALTLLLVFEIYIIVMLLSGLHLPCTCGGIISKMSWKQHLVFNGVFMIMGLIALLDLRKNLTIQKSLNKTKKHKDLSRA